MAKTTPAVPSQNMQTEFTGVKSAKVVDQGQAGYTFEVELVNGHTVVFSYQLMEAGEVTMSVQKTEDWQNGANENFHRMDIHADYIHHTKYGK